MTQPDIAVPENYRAMTREETTEIWVTFKVPGIHRYPDAPEEVAYLRNDHRHLFHFKVGITVFHDDREIEFHMFMNWLRGLYSSGTINVDYHSCEMLARDLMTEIFHKYTCELTRKVTVDVSEDGECGATLTSTPRG